MSSFEFQQIFENIDVKRIALLRLFNFGEPLINKGLPDILDVIYGSPKEISAIEISTNAQHHDFDTLEKAVRKRVITHLNISCDGDGTPEEYERLRPPSKWEKLLIFLERIADFRDRHDPKLKITTRTICTDRDHQKRWKSILDPFGVEPIFRPWHYLPGSIVNMTNREIKPKMGVCNFLIRPDRLYVDYDGSVVPCCVHPNAGDLGNLIETKLSTLLNAEKYTHFTDMMRDKRPAMKICNECEF
jgi:radical SAM protein with 4Fe4S-binding SPASM domain